MNDEAPALPPARAIWELWARMTAIYGHRWTSAYGDQPWPTDPATGQVAGEGAGTTWRDGLADFSHDAIRAGLGRCLDRASGWPPTLPEFRELCRPQPEELGIPDEESAFAEAARAASLCAPQTEWSHPTIVAAYRRMGRDRFQLPRQDARRAWAPIWRQVVQAYRDGELDHADTALPSPRTTTAEAKAADQETARRYLGAMRRKLGIPAEQEEG